MAKSLVELKHLEISTCANLEEIVSSTEDGQQLTHDQFFPKLESLELSSLFQLKRFYLRMPAAVNWPLKTLLLSDCLKVDYLEAAESSGLRNPCPPVKVKKHSVLFEKVPDCLKAKNLRNPCTQSTVKEYSVLFDKSSFSKLEHLTFGPKDICYDRPAHVKALFPAIGKDGSLPHLRTLRLHGMEKSMRLWEKFPHTGEDSLAFPQLEILELMFSGLTNLELSAISFRNLTTLKVTLCWQLQYLATYPVAQSLKQLETLKVDECKNMRVIFTSEGMEENASKCELQFWKLKHLELSDLINLERFSSSNCSVKVPRLESLKMDWCPFKLKVSPDKLLEVDVQEAHKDASDAKSSSISETNHEPRLPGITGSEHGVEAEIKEAPIDSQNIGNGEVMDLKQKQIVTDTLKNANGGVQLELKNLDDVQLEQSIRRLQEELRAQEAEMRDRQQRQLPIVGRLSDPSGSKLSKS